MNAKIESVISFNEEDGEIQVWWEDFFCLGSGSTRDEALQDAMVALTNATLECGSLKGK